MKLTLSILLLCLAVPVFAAQKISERPVAGAVNTNTHFVVNSNVNGTPKTVQLPPYDALEMLKLLPNWVAGEVSTAQLNTASNAVLVASGRVLYVRTNGTDATALVGDERRAWRNVSNAVITAISGDTIDVGAGFHWEPTNSMSLLKSNVNWIVPLGTTLAFGTTSDADNPYPVFHDWAGPIRCTFLGGGTFLVSNQLSQVFHLTNALSQVTVMFGDRIEQLGQVAAVEWGEADLAFIGPGDIISGYDAILGVVMGEPGPIYIDVRDILGGTDGGDSSIEFVKAYSQPGRAYIRARRARGDLTQADNVVFDIRAVDLATNNTIYSSITSAPLGNGILRGATVFGASNSTFARISVPDVGSPGNYRTAGTFIDCDFWGSTNRPIALVTNSGSGTLRFIGSRFRDGWGSTNSLRAHTGPQTVYLSDVELGHGLHSNITVGSSTNSFQRLKLYGDIDVNGGVHSGGPSEFTNTVDFFADMIVHAPGTFQTDAGVATLLQGDVTLTAGLDAVGGTFSGAVTAGSLRLQPISTFLRTTNRWFDGGLSSFYTNAFIANLGGVTNMMPTNLPVGSITRLEFTIEPGVSVGFPGTTAAQWGGILPFFSTNAGVWNVVKVSVPNAGVTNYRHSLEGSFTLAAGANITFTTNYVTGVISVASTGGSSFDGTASAATPELIVHPMTLNPTWVRRYIDDDFVTFGVSVNNTPWQGVLTLGGSGSATQLGRPNTLPQYDRTGFIRLQTYGTNGVGSIQYGALYYEVSTAIFTFQTNYVWESTVGFEDQMASNIVQMGLLQSITSSNQATSFVGWEWNPQWYGQSNWMFRTTRGGSSIIYTSTFPATLGTDWVKLGWVGNTNSIMAYTNGVVAFTNTTLIPGGTNTVFFPGIHMLNGVTNTQAGSPMTHSLWIDQVKFYRQ